MIQALQICASDDGCAGCPYLRAYDGIDCANVMMMDAVAYLTGSDVQRPIQPKMPRREYAKRAVLMLDEDGNVLKRFKCLSDAANAVYRHPTRIGACCRSESATTAGYRWMYEDDYAKQKNKPAP